MDAVEFLKAKVRMCENIHCEACGLHSGNIYCVTYCFVYPDEAVAAVEKWAKEHPIKTRQSEFLKVIPNAPMRIPMHELRKKRLQPQRIFRTCKTEFVHSRDACTQRRGI